MRRGGLVEGLAPGTVIRLTLLSLLAGLVVIAAGVFGLLVELGQKDLLLGVVIVLVAVAMVVVTLSITSPALLAARRDRKAPSRNVQGQLVGASRISPTPTLATIAVSIGKNVEQFRVRAEFFERVRAGATVVGLTVTPGLNHVQVLNVIRRDRLATMTEPPTTRAMRISVWLPLISLAAIEVGLGLGCLIGVLVPIGSSALHPLLALLLAMVFAGGIALGTRWYTRRLMGQLGL
jgi:hypothetical protein